MVFLKKHNLIMYLKNFLPQNKKKESDLKDIENNKKDNKLVELSDSLNVEN